MIVGAGVATRRWRDQCESVGPRPSRILSHTGVPGLSKWSNARMTIATLVAFHLFCLVSIGLVIIGLPGVWLILVLAAVLEWWKGDLFDLWTLIIAVVIAIIGEIVEFAAGAAGSHIGGGSRRAGVGAIVGGLVGGIAGAAFPPVLGALIWGVLGAGIGAAIAELTVKPADAPSALSRGGLRDMRTRAHKTMTVGGAAAAGRFVGLLTKTACAVVVWIMLLVDTFV